MDRGFAVVALHNPKTEANVGHALRACGVFGASALVTCGTRYHRSLPDTMKQYRHMPLFQVNDLRAMVPFDCVPVAVDIVDGAVALPEYEHPERAFYVFGAEDATLGASVLSWCRDVVVIPCRRCLNLAASVNVVLYDRAAKRKVPARDAVWEVVE